MRSSERVRIRWRAAVCAGLLMAGGATAQAQPFDLALTAAAADHAQVRKLGLIAGWTPAEPLWQGARWRLLLRHEVELAAWRVPQARNLIEWGYSPVFRFERPPAGDGALFFVEGAIGARLLSHTRVSAERHLSTAFQFADMLGLGWQWGPGGRSTLGLRLEHLSNLDIKKPNPGIEFVQLYYRYRF